MADKQIGEIAEILFPLATHLILTAPDQARALAVQEIAKLPTAANARIASSLEEALETIHRAAPEDVVFITGSLYLVGEARPILERMGLLK
jgi:dihydrofolate synthase/folylpolyglutamate synthase